MYPSRSDEAFGCSGRCLSGKSGKRIKRTRPRDSFRPLRRCKWRWNQAVTSIASRRAVLRARPSLARNFNFSEMSASKIFRKGKGNQIKLHKI